MANEYFNRDRSWVEFNARVLSEGCRADNPLLERLKFLAIVSSNFEEFFQVRVAALKRLVAADPASRDGSGEANAAVLGEISARVHELVGAQYAALRDEVLPALAAHRICYVPPARYTAQQESYAKNLFRNEIAPVLTPLRAGDGFTQLAGSSTYAAFALSTIAGIRSRSILPQILGGEAAHAEHVTAFVQIPRNAAQVVWLPADSGAKQFALLDDIVLAYGTQLFPGYTVDESLLFSVTRDADTGVDEDSGAQFIEAMEAVVDGRKSAPAIRMVCGTSSARLRAFLQEGLALSDADTYQVDGPVSLGAFEAVAGTDAAVGLCYEPWKNFSTKIPGVSIWQEIKRADKILCVPYQSFDPVARLVSDAADDPKVLAIKMTLYRTEKHSEIVKSLVRAARNGKQVTAFVELKARFDEQRNIGWAGQLEKAGAIVIYGIVNLKVHGKALLVIRREADGIRRYVHLGTGNYNARTARAYADVSLFTADTEIAGDITSFFNLISGYSALQTMRQVAMAPVDLKSRLLEMIAREAALSTPESPGLIIAKMNSLGHKEIVDALYAASRAGVRVMLNVRGICQLVPRVPGQSENISVVSVVGRYLEHARAFYFQNGGNEELYLSSADWMPRNLDRRIELMFPVRDKAAFAFLKDALLCFFRDDTHAHTLRADGTWQPPAPGGTFSAQESLYETFRAQHEQAKKSTALEFEVRRKD